MTSKDTNLDDLKRAMANATPTPNAAHKAEAMARSLEIFEAAQETQVTARQSSETPKPRGFLKGAFDMLMTRTTGALTATTALVAVGFLFLSPQGQQMLQGPPGPLVQVPVEEAQVVGADQGDNGSPALRSQAPTIERVLIEPAPEADVVADAEAPSLAPMVLPAPAPMVREALGGLADLDHAGDGVAQIRRPIQGLTLYSDGGPQNHIGTGDLALAPLPEDFANADDNPLRVVADDPVSTFSIDVDTASYALLRSTLNRGALPAPDAVRIEEMVNYFPYDYPAPTADDISPFRPNVQVFETPWNPDTQLVHIGIQGDLPVVEDRPPLNLVFLIDTSGSMNDPAKLPLLIQSFRLMLNRLSPEDEVAIVTYAGSAGVALEPTAASDTATINAALTTLQAGGSTNGVGGLEEAYRLAGEMMVDGEVSRVLLATDGDFNVGLSDAGALEDYIAEQRDTGIYLSVLGFGRGNLQDDTMQALAQNGNGTASYIDTLHEAQRVLVDQLAGALYPIADDLKVQVEFNPDVIAEYRLIGYETRALAREDFANDAVDAGDIGAGHSVTAIYEVTPVGSPAVLVAPLRYTADEGAPEAAFGDELGFISLRWKEPGADESQLIDFPIANAVADPGTEAQFAAAIAGFGQLLRGSDFVADWDYADAIALANANRGMDEFGYRTEAVQLMRLAQSLSGE
ncbi:vWA domain-containing protein [Jannaschia sp. CCS1]|uniref:vWA domain-containing protein n=1 Tax=Jannaschia sp. (strain CCS1) TaxID=290400 RepID=UPI000053D7DF|nr:VWA domain-containing protein [Jannaschia sp. CCS1]ABD53758.1 von Willebrand factor type A [Jannaschia sp. CCS1]